MSVSADTCQERAGFLFEHDCPRPAVRQCNRCGKPICALHGHPTDTQVLCTGCFKAKPPPNVDDESRDNPFLTSSYYYRGYGYYGRDPWVPGLGVDPNDFTEADGESLRAQRKRRQGEFEEDMGGS